MTDREKAVRVADAALFRSCDSPYRYQIIINRKEKLAVISREMYTDLIKIEVPSWSLRPRYQKARGLVRFFGLSPFFVFDVERRKHELRYVAIRSEIERKMVDVKNKLVESIMDTLYRNA
ncbi:MAG: hypothetical protein QW292_08615 [Candidatus Parvarchaeota archaeon]